MTPHVAEDLNDVTLYERLGGPAGIRRIVDGAVAAHMENPLIGHRFAPYVDQPERVEEIKAHTQISLPPGAAGRTRMSGGACATRIAGWISTPPSMTRPRGYPADDGRPAV